MVKIVTTPWRRVLFNSLKKKKKKIKNATVQLINVPDDYDFIVYFQIYWNNSSSRMNKLFHHRFISNMHTTSARKLIISATKNI